jgi:FSR family fosmidomycin resistance protein-like MFS transporter
MVFSAAPEGLFAAGRSSARDAHRHRRGPRLCQPKPFDHPKYEAETSYNVNRSHVTIESQVKEVGLSTTQIYTPLKSGSKTVLEILLAISFCHLLNDMISSLLPAIYPLLKEAYHLDFAEVGLITLTYQCTASLLQPLVGFHTDRRPMPYSLPAGMGFTLVGLIILSMAHSFGTILFAAALVGTGASVFHPESSRVARMASGGQHGLAQSLFQLGGNAGLALGPLLAAVIVLPRGQPAVAWFTLAVLLAILLLSWVSRWTNRHMSHLHASLRIQGEQQAVSGKRVVLSITVLLALLFSKFFYLASITSYYTFYLMGKFHVSVRSAQIHLFVFLGAVALGTIAGGPIGDRIGRKRVIWSSILGVLPFTLALPYANLLWTEILSVLIGLILASAFPAIVVYGQELVPGRVGMVSGLFFGFAFGMAGLGAAVLGELADLTSIRFVYLVCSVLPAVGLLAAFLPNLERSSIRTVHETADAV